jgi:hypothetical protein
MELFTLIIHFPLQIEHTFTPNSFPALLFWVLYLQKWGELQIIQSINFFIHRLQKSRVPT